MKHNNDGHFDSVCRANRWFPHISVGAAKAALRDLQPCPDWFLADLPTTLIKSYGIQLPISHQLQVKMIGFPPH
jgi:hypothetical protein